MLTITGEVVENVTFKVADGVQLKRVGSLFRNCDFRNVDFSMAIFETCAFIDCKFGANKFDDATFLRCNLEKVDWTGSSLRGTTINLSNLNSAILRKCDLTKSFITQNSLENVCFDECIVIEARIFGNNATGCSWKSLIRFHPPTGETGLT